MTNAFVSLPTHDPAQTAAAHTALAMQSHTAAPRPTGLTGWYWKCLKPSYLYALTLMGRKLKRIYPIQREFWRGNAKLGDALLNGAFTLTHQTFLPRDFVRALESPDNVPPVLSTYVQSFAFLYDLSALSENSARKQARQIIERWIHFHHALAAKCWLSQAWRPGILGNRLSVWLSVYDFYASTADDDFKQALLGSMDKQLRTLRRHWQQETCPQQQFWAIKGLLMGFEALVPLQSIQPSEFKCVLKTLLFNNAQLLLADGGHVSRSPRVHWRHLRDLIDIRSNLQLLSHKIQKLPATPLKGCLPPIEEALMVIQASIQKMTPLLRLLRHGDGALAHFYAAIDPAVEGLCCGITAESVDSVLSVTDAETTRPPQRAPITGFERSANRSAVLLVNTYPLQAFDATAHKTSLAIRNPSHSEAQPEHEPGLNILAFEWSVGRNRFIVKGDVVIQKADRTWVIQLTEKNIRLHIKRHAQEGQHYLAFECTYRDADLSFQWQRQLFMAHRGEELRGIDRLVVSEDVLIGIRFILNPLFCLSGEGEKIDITCPLPPSKRDEKLRRKPISALASDAALVRPPVSEAADARRKADQQEWLFRSKGADETLMTANTEAERTLLLMKACEANLAHTFNWSFSQKS